jgi:hypothetical protein
MISTYKITYVLLYQEAKALLNIFATKSGRLVVASGGAPTWMVKATDQPKKS